MTSFTGFSPQTFSFLKNLKDNNFREWFEQHREEFSKDLQHPFINLVSDLAPIMLKMDSLLEIKPPKKMISRIFRDLRFSKDKSPYRSNMWLSFHRSTDDWKQDPTYFFELMPDHYRYGMGFSRPGKKFMNTMRMLIETKPKEFQEINTILLSPSPFRLMGTEYIRQLKPHVEIPPDLMAWYQKKGELYIMASFPIDEIVLSKKLLMKLETDFKKLLPIYNFFWKLKRISDQSDE